MAYSQAQNRATQKYIKENLEEVRFRVKKGERTLIKQLADNAGQSMTQYIIQAINARAGQQIRRLSGKYSRRVSGRSVLQWPQPASLPRLLR